MTDDAAAFQSVVNTSVQNTLVTAPPGSGKTELLARRAALLIESLEPHQRILALTFSNKAKANLSSRLVNVLGAEKKRRHITVHNFHGHAAEIVRSHGRTLGIGLGFEMPDKRTQSLALSGHLEDLPETAAHEMSRTIEEELRQAKQGARSDAVVLEILEKSAHPNTLTVETTRQVNGAVFYDDLLRHAQRLLRVSAIARLYRTHYGALLVDEFQDLSPQQLDIALRTCDASRTFVGDPLQGIYSWTGARPIEVERILRRIGGAPYGLGISYRSSPRVLELLGSVSEQLGGKAMQASEPEKWFEGGISSGVLLPSGNDEAAFIRKTCSEILERQPKTTIGIICRSGWRRKPIDTEFASSDTPHARWDLAVDNSHVINLIKASVTRLGGSPSAETLKADVLSNIASEDVDTAADVIDALEQLAQLAEETGSINGALTGLKTLADGLEAVAPGVHLLNAHTGKGQQFDWVFVPGFEDGNVPSFLASGRTQLEEEHRVLLVMLSRARHGIVLTRAKSLISKRGKPYDTKASRWSGEVRPALSNAAALAEHIGRLPMKPNQDPAEAGGT